MLPSSYTVSLFSHFHSLSENIILLSSSKSSTLSSSHYILCFYLIEKVEASEENFHEFLLPHLPPACICVYTLLLSHYYELASTLTISHTPSPYSVLSPTQDSCSRSSPVPHIINFPLLHHSHQIQLCYHFIHLNKDSFLTLLTFTF